MEGITVIRLEGYRRAGLAADRAELESAFLPKLGHRCFDRGLHEAVVEHLLLEAQWQLVEGADELADAFEVGRDLEVETRLVEAVILDGRRRRRSLVHVDLVLENPENVGTDDGVCAFLLADGRANVLLYDAEQKLVVVERLLAAAFVYRDRRSPRPADRCFHGSRATAMEVAEAAPRFVKTFVAAVDV